MEVEITKMSSRGQIVIPQDIREEFKIKEGSAFAVFGGNDTILLRKLKQPSKEEMINKLEAIAESGEKRAEKLGIRHSDIVNIVHKRRKSK